MDYGIESKLRKFLNDKMSECLDNAKKCEKKHLKDVLSDIRQCCNLYGFALEKEDKNWRGEIFYTFKKSEETITISSGIGKKLRWSTYPTISWSTYPTISLKIGEISSSSCYYINIYPDLVYQVFKHSEEIEEEFFALKSKLEKAAKIADISGKSIETWLPTMLADTGYQYYITKDEHKLTLSIKVRRGVQLDIPIYFNKFQKIMPDLLA
ncbi:MAG: hypothetical protein LBQ64_06045, partial [Bacteroidales bacterium]|nr:hypothetical protein [Bacteroidales bacterium]